MWAHVGGSGGKSVAADAETQRVAHHGGAGARPLEVDAVENLDHAVPKLLSAHAGARLAHFGLAPVAIDEKVHAKGAAFARLFDVHVAVPEVREVRLDRRLERRFFGIVVLPAPDVHADALDHDLGERRRRLPAGDRSSRVFERARPAALDGSSAVRWSGFGSGSSAGVFRTRGRAGLRAG